MNLSAQNALSVWHQSIATAVRLDAPDLSARQMALMSTGYMEEPPHSVRGLALTLNISKPAMVPALDTLGRLDYVRRRRDVEDRRNVLLQRTDKGSVYLSEFSDIVIAAAREI